MKRLAVSLLLLSLLFSIVGCSEAGSPSTTVTTIATTTPDTTAGNTTGTSPVDETTIPTTASSEPNTCQIGNIVFTGPNDMEIDINSDGVYQIVLTPSKAYVVATYTDVSSLDKEMLDILLYTASNGQDADRGQVADLSELSEIIAGFEATGEGYASTNTNGVNIYYIDLTFTDTWNLYTIQFLCNAQDDNWTDYLQLFSDFIDSAEYVGETPRSTENTSDSDNQAEDGSINNPYPAGIYKVGNDIPSGEYIFVADSGAAYVCVSNDSNQDDIIENENFNYTYIITVSDGQYLQAKRCSFVTADDHTLTINDDGSFHSGMYRVGVDIAPGEYKLIAEDSDQAYYCIYNNSAVPLDIVNNDIFEGSTYVTVQEGQYLLIKRCSAYPVD